MENGKSAGNSDVITRQYYDSLLIEMRVLDSVFPSTGITLFGRELRTPIMTAAFSRLNETCEDGFAKLAEGAKAAGTAAWMGIGGDEEFRALAASGVPAVKIIKPYRDNDEILRQLEVARSCGAMAAGVDVDHCVAKDGTVAFTREGDAVAPKTTEEIRSFAEAAGIPFIVKGVLSVHDAVKSAEAGAGAIVVSHNHAIMPCAVPPARLLPQIARELKGRVVIIVDCGIAGGADAFKALALGADAVCVGRPLLGPLIKEGADGVRKLLQTMTDELAGFLARTGSPDPMHIDHAVIHHT